MQNKEFNITGTCIPEKHFMADVSDKLEKILALITTGKYFTINRPRQYGKTTTMYLLKQRLEADYIVIKTSFEGVGNSFFANEKSFCSKLLQLFSQEFKSNNPEIHKMLVQATKEVEDLDNLSSVISKMAEMADRKIVLMIDEVDRTSNNQLFLNFLGVLRNKYLSMMEGEDHTFFSVILAGVYDVKNLKLKLRSGEEEHYNSPWNIAVDFNIDMSLNQSEIASMLSDYSKSMKCQIDTGVIASRLFFYTNGYPFLVSKLCKIVAEKIKPTVWMIEHIDQAVKLLLKESNPNFDNITKELENNRELYDFVEKILLGSQNYEFVIQNPLINLGMMLGLLRDNHGLVELDNIIYENLIKSYMVSKIQTSGKNHDLFSDSIQSIYLKKNGDLDFDLVLKKFQEVIKEKYSKSDLLKSDEFLEKDLRMLFLVFLKPIINGVGFSFKEVESSSEKRLDLVVVFKNQKIVVEMKLWRGDSYYQRGVEQLLDYIDRENVDTGYLLIMDKSRSKNFAIDEDRGLKVYWV